LGGRCAFQRDDVLLAAAIDFCSAYRQEIDDPNSTTERRRNIIQELVEPVVLEQDGNLTVHCLLGAAGSTSLLKMKKPLQLVKS
jgi:hypothetical protein